MRVICLQTELITVDGGCGWALLGKVISRISTQHAPYALLRTQRDDNDCIVLCGLEPDSRAGIISTGTAADVVCLLVVLFYSYSSHFSSPTIVFLGSVRIGWCSFL